MLDWFRVRMERQDDIPVVRCGCSGYGVHVAKRAMDYSKLNM